CGRVWPSSPRPLNSPRFSPSPSMIRARGARPFRCSSPPSLTPRPTKGSGGTSGPCASTRSSFLAPRDHQGQPGSHPPVPLQGHLEGRALPLFILERGSEPLPNRQHPQRPARSPLHLGRGGDEGSPGRGYGGQVGQVLQPP